MNLLIHQIVVTVNEDTEPALGTYGWVWVLAIGVGVFALYQRYQRRQERARAAEHHKYMWKQRSGETVEAWQERVKEQEFKRKEWSRQANERAARRSYRSSRGSSHNRRGDFDPPGGWGGMGPDMG